jgi:hypothetical protein
VASNHAAGRMAPAKFSDVSLLRKALFSLVVHSDGRKPSRQKHGLLNFLMTILRSQTPIPHYQ